MTSEEILKNYNPQDLTFEKVWLLFQETDKKFQETDKKIKDTNDELGKKIDKLFEITKRHSNFVNNFAETTEQFFISAFESVLNKDGKIEINGYVFDDMKSNYIIGKKKRKKEIDILLINSEERLLGIIEVKTKLHPDNLDIADKLREYIDYDYAFSGYNFILGFATFNASNDVIEECRKRGIFLVFPNYDKTSLDLESLKKVNPKLF